MRRLRSGPLLALALAAGIAASPPAAAAPPAIRVAVIDFQGTGQVGEYASLGAGLQSMLTTDLASSRSITVVERTRLSDLQRELKLGRSAAADPATALRVGKLAGATHLVTGTFTLVGKELRLDARAIEVATGRVVLATDAHGERDAFFELEKKLAGAIVAGIGVTLNPKERASFARIHTADWEAFRRFGDGLRLFDDADYDRSLEALREATAKDQEFGLARTTLDTYEKLASEVRSRATVIEAETRAKSAQARRQLHADEQAIIDRLLAVAGRKGAAARASRAAALYLAVALLVRSADVSDEGLDLFARERLRDALVARYVREADGLFPALPIVPFQPMGERFGGPEPPRSPADVDRAVDAALALFATYGVNPIRDAKDLHGYKEEHLVSLFGRTFEETARCMHLDYRSAADLLDRFYAVGARFSPDGRWRRGALVARAERRRRLLDIDASTRLFKEAASLEADPGALRGLAREIDSNAGIARVLATPRAGGCLREWTLAAIEQSTDSVARRLADDAKLPDLCAADIVRWDRTKLGTLDLFDTLPIWIFQSDRRPSFTGPRPGPGRFTDLQYLGGKSRDRSWTLAILEGVPRAGAALRLELSYDLPPDTGCGRRLDCPAPGERPIVTLFFDASNVHVRAPRHDGARDDVPLEAVGLAIGAGIVKRVDLRALLASERGGTIGPSSIERAQQPLAAPATGTLPIIVRRQERRLVLEASGHELVFEAPPAQGGVGFLGFLIEGPGFVRIAKAQVLPAR